jgi:EAL domain-containing protein (putative c-di-GMP-specific phosphodiesterase class I)
MDKVSADGTDTCVNVDADMMKRMQRDECVESALGRAVNNDSIEVYFQPIYSNGSRKIRSAEALARLYDPELGFIPPDEFIPKAEQNGSIMQLGRQVFEKTCRFIRDNDLDSLGIDYIEVNLSPVQCLHERLAEELLEAAHEYGISMDRVNLEITETSTMDSDVTGNNMKRLIENGASFSLDDYGTGFSNLINILNLPLRIVKIDKSIVWSYFNDSRDILPHVIRMFRSQKLEILAEGVETEQMADELADMGCDYEQGFYFSKPVPPAEFIRYVKKVNAG